VSINRVVPNSVKLFPSTSHPEGRNIAPIAALDYVLVLKKIQLTPEIEAKGEQQATNTIWGNPRSLFLRVNEEIESGYRVK
jgi:hypothetical protein